MSVKGDPANQATWAAQWKALYEVERDRCKELEKQLQPDNDDLANQARMLFPEGIRIEDRRPVAAMTDRPALLLLAQCPRCNLLYVFVTSERDTCNYSTVCEACR